MFSTTVAARAAHTSPELSLATYSICVRVGGQQGPSLAAHTAVSHRGHNREGVACRVPYFWLGIC